MTDDHRPTPEIRITGDASAEEVAALVAVLAAASGGDDPPPERDGSRWASHRAALRTSVPHGPGAWRGSARP